MENIFEYAVLRATPDPLRGETVNVGLVVFHAQTVDVYLAPSLRKLTALDGSIDVNDILELPETIKQWTSRFDTVAEKFEAIKHFGFVTMSERGKFRIAGSMDYNAHVERLMKNLVVPRQREGFGANVTNRITTRLKELFEKRDVFGRSHEDIERHLVVQNFPIAPKENLYAHFALRNGHLWITETTDFRARTNNQLDNSRVAALAAIKLDKARGRFRGVKTFVVYAAHSESEVGSQLNLLRDYAHEVVNLRNRSQMAEYMQKILSAAGSTGQLAQ